MLQTLSVILLIMARLINLCPLGLFDMQGFVLVCCDQPALTFV